MVRSRVAVAAAVAALALALALALLASPVTAQAGPATLDYPGTGSCSTTLQACIDGANPGDTIRVVTNIRIDENVTITKSLTLTAGQGFHPVIGSATGTDSELVQDNQGSRVVVTFSNLTFRNARVTVFLAAQLNDRFTLVHSTIEHHADNNNDYGVEVNAFALGATATILDNTIRTTGQPIELNTNLQGDATTARLTAIGNRLSPSIPGDASNGIAVNLAGSGLPRIDLLSNVLAHFAACQCGDSGGIRIGTVGSVHATLNVVGNTVDHTQDFNGGILVLKPTQTSRFVLNTFDNVVTASQGPGIALPPATPHSAVHAGFNDSFGNAMADDYGGYAKGPGTVSIAPGYVNAGARNYRLKATSPLVDLGLTCDAGGLPRTDADGHFRIQNRNVDMGAFEQGAGPVPAGKNVFGTAFHDTLAGTAGEDVICGLDGPDTIDGKGGADHVFGGEGADHVAGSAGADWVTGGPGPDVLSGGTGNDHVDAKDSSGGDSADGGPGQDLCLIDPGDHATNCP